MSNIVIEGTIKEIKEIQLIKPGFSKRALIVETDDQWPQVYEIEFLKTEKRDSTTKLNPLKKGDSIKVDCNLKGREWTNKEDKTSYFLSLNGWNVELQNQAPAPFPAADAEKPTDGLSDDVPF